MREKDTTRKKYFNLLAFFEIIYTFFTHIISIYSRFLKLSTLFDPHNFNLPAFFEIILWEGKVLFFEEGGVALEAGEFGSLDGAVAEGCGELLLRHG